MPDPSLAGTLVDAADRPQFTDLPRHAMDADVTLYWPWVRPCWEEPLRDATPPVLLVDAIALGRDLEVAPATIRKWASRGRIARLGRDTRGRTLYDYDQVAAIVTPRSSTTAVPGH